MQVSWCAVSGLLDHLLLPRGAHAPSVPGEVVGQIRGCEEWVQCDGTHEYTLTAHRGTREGAGHIRGCEEWVQCDGTHEYTLTAHMQRWGLSHSSPNFPRTAPYSPPPPPHSSPNMYTRVNVKPDEEEHTNSNVGTHNIAIGGTLG